MPKTETKPALPTYADQHPHADDGKFALKNAPARARKLDIANSDRTKKQKKLLDGMDSLPGQLDLFAKRSRRRSAASVRKWRSMK